MRLNSVSQSVENIVVIVLFSHSAGAVVSHLDFCFKLINMNADYLSHDETHIIKNFKVISEGIDFQDIENFKMD